VTLIISGDGVRRLLSLQDCIDAVEQAFRAHGEGRVEAGVLSVHAHDGAFHTKSAIAGPWFGVKTNANFPSNPSAHGLPTIQGVMLLFDAGDGRPLAVIDSIELTAMRTAAASAVAAKALARPGSSTAMIVGCGPQGRMHLEALALVLPLTRAVVLDADEQRAKDCASEMSAKLGIPVTATSDLHQEADVWVTCTTSRTAFLDLEHVRPGAFVAAVGADNPAKSEITPRLMARSRIVTDVTDQCVDIGDLRHAIAAGAVPRGDVVAQLGEVIARSTAVRRTPDDIVIFDSTGAGFQDTAAAAVIYERARRDSGYLDVQFRAT
jgi:ornithine cyclodeaminase/alanine dehydrogenase-like protein (mu-crystallin family)